MPGAVGGMSIPSGTAPSGPGHSGEQGPLRILEGQSHRATSSPVPGAAQNARAWLS